MRKVLAALAVIVAAALLWAWLATRGFFGEVQPSVSIVGEPRSAAQVEESTEAQATVRQRVGQGSKQILFGDLHAHSTFSFDANNISLPMYGGEGSHPPANACDFARYCSALDFWSINDHAEGLTPRQWSITQDVVRQCNAAAGSAVNPDMVTFLGWEWTQIGNTPESHYGHKNVILRDIEAGAVPARPISSREQLFPGGGDPFTFSMRLLLLVQGYAAGDASPIHDFIAFIDERDQLVGCPSGMAVRDLPLDCQESAPTPGELYRKLDDWAFPYMVIPHGNSWGFYTPPRTSWDKQLSAHRSPTRHEPLIEVFSGHGNIENYRPWRARLLDESGREVCAPPAPGYLPECWRAGQIIEERCLAEGRTAEDCDELAAATRANFILSKDAGHWTIPGTGVEDWLDSGQCSDCYMPAFNHRPTSSMQYGLAIRDFNDADNSDKRYRWGVIGSSDVHTARPGTGYKEFRRRNMSDAALGLLGPPSSLKDPEPRAEFLPHNAALGPNFERFTSFFGTGGLVAVHSEGRDRDAIWSALERKEVYATSGDRILLWFNLEDGDGQLPMGSSTRRDSTPRFTVSAAGAFEQKPGCPEDTLRAVPSERLERLCYGECYNPGDTRKRIERIEVVRILPQGHAGEPVDGLIADPWKVLPCPAGDPFCTVSFEDPEFEALGRDALYYVRALQAPSPTVNAGNLRCEYDEAGQCLTVKPCGPDTPDTDDCLVNAAERAWSSPIFVDWLASGDAGSEDDRAVEVVLEEAQGVTAHHLADVVNGQP